MFAPGIAGAVVIANLSRVLFVIGRLKIAAVTLGGSWLIVIVADVVLVQLVPARLVVAMLAMVTRPATSMTTSSMTPISARPPARRATPGGNRNAGRSRRCSRHVGGTATTTSAKFLFERLI